MSFIVQRNDRKTVEADRDRILREAKQARVETDGEIITGTVRSVEMVFGGVLLWNDPMARRIYCDHETLVSCQAAEAAGKPVTMRVTKENGAWIGEFWIGELQ